MYYNSCKIVNHDKKVICNYYKDLSQKDIHRVAKTIKLDKSYNLDSVKMKLNFN